MINQKNKIFQSRFLIIKYSVPTIESWQPATSEILNFQKQPFADIFQRDGLKNFTLIAKKHLS